jgi:transposase
MLNRGVHRNAVVVAMANKIPRTAWATLRNGNIF